MPVTISPNMGMPIPVVGQDPGPDWATNIDASLSIVDSHNHTPGQGVAITPSAIDINADLPLNDNNLITARTVRFSPQITAPADPADLGCLTEIGVDLYYIDGSGNVIRLTQAGSPAGATGTITGLPSGTASASFAGSTFTFQSATNTPASMAVGPLIIGQPVLAGKTVTVSPNGAQPANYSLTLPLALPSVTSTIVSDTSGNLSFNALQSGTYAPTITGGSFGTGQAASGTWKYMRIGNIVTVMGFLTGTTTLQTDRYTIEYTFTLPINPTSNFAAITDLGGSIGNCTTDFVNPTLTRMDVQALTSTVTGSCVVSYNQTTTPTFSIMFTYSCA